MSTSRPRSRDMNGDDAIPPVEFSTNPLIRGALKDKVVFHQGSEIMDTLFQDDDLIEQTISDDMEHRLISMHKEVAINRAILLMLLVQLPAGFISFLLSPTAEWEVIAACFTALLGLKWLARKNSSLAVLVASVVISSALVGCLVGESIHVGWLILTDHFQPSLMTGIVIGLAFILCFYISFIGDILYIKRTNTMLSEIKKEGDKVLIVSTLMPLEENKRWWITWGLASSSVWSPLHGVYLLARLVDWLTIKVLLPQLSVVKSIIRAIK